MQRALREGAGTLCFLYLECGDLSPFGPSRPVANTIRLSLLLGLRRQGAEGQSGNKLPHSPKLIRQTRISNLLSNRYLRLLLVTVLVGFCLWTIKAAGAFGLSRLLVRFTLATPHLTVAQEAIKLTPADAEAHFAGAAAFSSLNMNAESVAEMERAVALRPADYSLWLQLGLLRDQLGETDSALAAFDQAVTLAPFYARPRWQRGNLLLRAGKYDQAFMDLNRAAQSNPELIPALIDLAWNVSRGDPNLTEQWAQINSDRARLAFARFFARQGRPTDVISQLRRTEVVPEASRRELVELLLAKGAFEGAFEVWTSGHGSEIVNPQTATQIYDGGFEAPLIFDAKDFGWRLPRNFKGVVLSVNSSQPHSGSRSLRIDFAGDSPPGVELASQLILVEPSRSYQINFASRSQELITGGLPLIVITDAQGERKRLGESAPLGGTGASDWRVGSFEFSTGPTARAVVLSLQRENCSTSPCPVFGSLSLDSFSVAQSARK